MHTHTHTHARKHTHTHTHTHTQVRPIPTADKEDVLERAVICDTYCFNDG